MTSLFDPQHIDDDAIEQMKKTITVILFINDLLSDEEVQNWRETQHESYFTIRHLLICKDLAISTPYSPDSPKVTSWKHDVFSKIYTKT